LDKQTLEQGLNEKITELGFLQSDVNTLGDIVSQRDVQVSNLTNQLTGAQIERDNEKAINLRNSYNQVRFESDVLAQSQVHHKLLYPSFV